MVLANLPDTTHVIRQMIIPSPGFDPPFGQPEGPWGAENNGC